MSKSPRKLVVPVCGALALAAVGILAWKGIELTSLLARQASLVFEDGAGREARSRIPDLLAALEAREGKALVAIRDAAGLPAVLQALPAAHPVMETPFVIGADRGLVWPPSPPPSHAALSDEETAPDSYLSARRMALAAHPGDEAASALAAVSSAPEIAGAWRLRARVTLARLRWSAGDAGGASELYGSVEADFPEELRDAARPSRGQIAAARALALDAAGRRDDARAVLLRALEAASSAPDGLGGDDAGLLLRKAALLDLPPGGAATKPLDDSPGDGFRARIAALIVAREHAARTLSFARRVRDWVLPRLGRGGGTERFAEQAGGERVVVVLAPAPAGQAGAAGFRLNLPGVAGALNDVIAAPSVVGGAEAPGRPLPFQVVPGPRPGFRELAALPGALEDLRIGVDEESWRLLVGEARRPFRIAGILISALSVVLLAAVALGLRVYTREMFLARMKTEFVANVSHELKTPLALIRLFAETLLLDRVRDPEKARGYFAIITRESERLTHLVDNILEFASLDAGRKRFELRPTELGRVVEETLAAYRHHLEEHGFQVELAIEEGLPQVAADPDAAAQALINLLNNAVKYSPERKEVSVRVSGGNGAVRVAVADRGIGIAPTERKRVFEDFYRSPAARGLGTRGSGLGLTLVRRILVAHGGEVELESVVGEGSTFTLVFPVRSETARPETTGEDETARSAR